MNLVFTNQLKIKWTSFSGKNKTHFSDFLGEKVQKGNDQEKAQSEKESHSKNRGGKNQINNQVLIPCKHIVSRKVCYRNHDIIVKK